MDKTTHVYIPKAIVFLYAILAIGLVPWITNLADNLPAKHLAAHWDAVWVGFDMIMLVVVLLTVFFAVKRMIWAVFSATALATLFIVDAWFDILTSKTGSEQKTAEIFGSLEILLAIFTLGLVYHVVRQTPTKRSNIKISSKKHRKK